MQMNLTRFLMLSLCLSMFTSCQKKANAPKQNVEQITPVRTATIGSAGNAPTIRVTGAAAWRKETLLGFTSGGQIARVFPNEGDRVRSGQLLAILKTAPFGADLEAAQAEARRASQDYVRIKTLFRKGWVTRQRLEASEATAKAAQAAVEARRFSLETARIISPSAGTVLARLAEPNQVVGAGQAVLTLGEGDGGLVLRAPINDRDVGRIRLSVSAAIGFSALGDDILKGKVIEVGAKANSTTGTFDVEISLPADKRLKSGMIGTADVFAEPVPKNSVWFAPPAAIMFPRAGEALVYLLDGSSRARLRTVKIGEPTDMGVEIKAGLSPGDTVITSGLDRLREGARV
jgi:RND family efflux transporter MFP subunit